MSSTALRGRCEEIYDSTAFCEINYATDEARRDVVPSQTREVPS
jgi:hypothetical protein